MAFSAYGTCVSTRYGRSCGFHGHLESSRPWMTTAHHALIGFEPLRCFPNLVRLDTATAVPGPSGCVPNAGRCWNINQLPIRWIRLRATLGPTNPRLTSIVEEPLPQSAVGILTPLCCYSFHDSRHNAVHRTSRPCFDPRNAPSYPITLRWGTVSVIRLSPVHFRGPRP